MAEKETALVRIIGCNHFAPSVEEAMKKGAVIEIRGYFKEVGILKRLNVYTFLVKLDEVKSLEKNTYEIAGHLQKDNSILFSGKINIKNKKISGDGIFSG